MVTEKVKQALLSISIAVLIALFFGYTLSEIYKGPEYHEYCKEETMPREGNTRQECEEKAGKWNNYSKEAKQCLTLCTYTINIEAETCKKIGGKGSCEITEILNENECITRQGQSKKTNKCQEQGYCDTTYECRQKYDKDNEKYRRNIFLIGLPIGIAIITIGTLTGATVTGGGLMAGGIITTIWATIPYWGELSKWIRLIMLAIALAVLIILANKRFR
ncbi:hypothetical protein HY486_00150 [Candidatus Woesearchaeota archaeon]|nr:hypothetical protein [Candidatus Woesearchaeota archaeon]